MSNTKQPKPFLASTAQGEESDTLLIKATSLEAWFYQTLKSTRQEHDLEATEASEHYIVTLLDAFSSADQLFGVDGEGRRQDQALAMILYEAVFDAPRHSSEHYRRLGDVALYIAGVFADSLRHRSVDVTYYINMGQGAYGALADRMRHNRSLREVFVELADTFAGWVEVLRDVSERLGLSTGLKQQETSELYARIPAASGRRGELIYGELARRGAMPGRGWGWQT
jgi:hypothetical protein